MARQEYTAEQIIAKRREAEIALAKGLKTPQGGLRVDQAKRLRQLEQESARLKRVVADLTLDNSILKEVSSRYF